MVNFDSAKLLLGLLHREIFYTVRKEQVLIEGWRQEYEHICPPSCLGYNPSAPAARTPADFSNKVHDPIDHAKIRGCSSPPASTFVPLHEEIMDKIVLTEAFPQVWPMLPCSGNFILRQ